jgi:hypothetical protein
MTGVILMPGAEWQRHIDPDPKQVCFTATGTALNLLRAAAGATTGRIRTPATPRRVTNIGTVTVPGATRRIHRVFCNPPPSVTPVDQRRTPIIRTRPVCRTSRRATIT